jgi:membrane protein implicated in regulation of membrane protease activity
MTWQTFYLTTFLIGFLLTVVSFVAGFVHLPFGHGMHFPHGGHGVGHGLHGVHGGPGTHAGPSSRGPGLSPLNVATGMAFLAWFGGAGYLATSRAHVLWLVALVVATVAGLVGAGIVFAFLAKVLVRHEATLDPADFEMTGTLARVIVPIREGGTGEISFSHGRTRRCSGARRDGQGALPRGAEVVVTRYEKGIAYVRPFETSEL